MVAAAQVRLDLSRIHVGIHQLVVRIFEVGYPFFTGEGVQVSTEKPFVESLQEGDGEYVSGEVWSIDCDDQWCFSLVQIDGKISTQPNNYQQ